MYRHPLHVRTIRRIVSIRAVAIVMRIVVGDIIIICAVSYVRSRLIGIASAITSIVNYAVVYDTPSSSSG